MYATFFFSSLIFTDIEGRLLFEERRFSPEGKAAELLVDSLKAEVYSDTQSYLNYEDVKGGLHDYDEIFDDDDGYPD